MRKYVMTSRFKVRPLPLMAVGALVACLTFTSPGYAQARKAPPQQNKQAQEAIAQQKKLVEAEALRDAYLLMAGANHDYDGHRVKAMRHLEKAVGILDKSIMAKGTAMQKAMTVLEDQAAAAAKGGAQATPALHENQRASDAQMRKALVLVAEVQKVLAQNKRAAPLGHVNDAIKEVNIALKIR
jgi:hypothetical protein